MAFVVEDGTGLNNANALIDVAFADNYHSDRGRASWAAFNTTKKQQCIIAATDYIEKRFGRKFKGSKTFPLQQALYWPRFNVYDDDRNLICMASEIPLRLKMATAEYALRAGLIGELAPDPMPLVPPQDLSPSTPTINTEFQGGLVKRVSEKVDVIEETKSYQTIEDVTSASQARQGLTSLVTTANLPEYPAADLLLEELVTVGRRRLARG